MKSFAKIVAGAAVVASAIFTTQANAALVYQGLTSANTSTFIGSYDPTQEDFAFFNTVVTTGSFLNTYIFDIAPAGEGTASANFVPVDRITDFVVKLFAVKEATCGALGTVCTGVSLEAVALDTGKVGGTDSSVDWFDLDVGRFAWVVSGVVKPDSTGSIQTALVSGQFTTRPAPVPEPASLALFGAALLGLAAVRRKRV